MSFIKLLEETNNATGFSKEQKFILFIGKAMEKSNYKLKMNDNDFFKDFKNQENKFLFDFVKNGQDYVLKIQNKKDGKYEISITLDNRTVSEEIKLDNYYKENDDSLINNYMKERIKDIESNPLLYREPPKMFKHNVEYNNFNFDNRNNFQRNELLNNNYYFQSNEPERNFSNIGYNDLHGDLPSFVPNFNNRFGRPMGNLMGPDAFNLVNSGRIRYDPITPFGPRFDFIPQYDGTMNQFNNDSLNNEMLGISNSNSNKFNNINNFGDNYNPFI